MTLLPVAIHVDASRRLGPHRPIWNWFGYDEPNYTYLPHGKKLLGQLAALHPGPVYVRASGLHARGAVDGTGAVPPRLPEHRSPRRHHGLGLAAEGLRALGRADRSLGPPRRRALRHGARRRLALGNLERAGRLVLARH